MKDGQNQGQIEVPGYIIPGALPVVLLIVLDKSESMGPLRQAVVDSLKNLRIRLQTCERQIFLSVTTFNHEQDFMIIAEPIHSVDEAIFDTYETFGSTALRQTVSRVIRGLGPAFKKINPPPQVICTIFSDGHDTSSPDKPHYQPAKIAELVAEYRKSNWNFLYFGFGEAALLEQATAMGITNSASFEHSVAGVRSAFGGITDSFGV